MLVYQRVFDEMCFSFFSGVVVSESASIILSWNSLPREMGAAKEVFFKAGFEQARSSSNQSWLVVWNMNFIFPFSWEFHHPN